MKRHDLLNQELRENLALHVLDLLPDDEAAEMEAHRENCSACRADEDSLRPLIDDLADLAPNVTPPPSLKARLFERLKAEEPAEDPQVWKRWPDSLTGTGMITVPGDETDWEETDIPGIRVKRLFVSQAEDRCTMMVQMDPGTAYPPHIHGGPEECFVLEGDIHGDDFSLARGDFQRAEKDSTHSTQRTVGGCLLLIQSSLNDRLVSSS